MTAPDFWTQLKTAQLITGWKARLSERELIEALGCSRAELLRKLQELSEAGLIVTSRSAA